MSWVNDLCKSIKSKCWCWCQCICCPNGDVHTDNDEDLGIDTPSTTSSVRIENKIKAFYQSLPNTPSSEKNAFINDTSMIPESLQENDHIQKEKHETRLVLPLNR